MSIEQAEKALQKAKIALMSEPDTTFFITVCFSMKHRFDECIPTAGTNGTEIIYNPTYFLSLTEKERLFLLLHETMHVVFLHITRLKERNMKRWNYAGDYVINYLLKQRGYKMPEGGLYDKKYADMSTEQVYDLLKDEELSEDFEIDILEPEGDIDQVQQDLDDILVRASIQSKMSGDSAGTIPGEVELYINGLLDPILPWHQILRRYMNRMVKTDYSFRRPNKRFFPDAILPTLHSEGLDDIAIAIDTSGSVSDEQFNQFVSEAYGILKFHKPDVLTLLQFDTSIKDVSELRSASDFSKLTFTGRGGTCIHPVLSWAQEKKPKLMIIFTDGYFHNAHPDPKVPVLWLIHSQPNYKAPYGRVIPYTLKA